MPIQTQNLGKYKRPGIFIEEIDQSIIQLPVQNVLVNLVPGFSKKGPINSPVYVESQNDFIAIFGDIDRQLERKGSFFHRTVLKMLETGPVWALNLLSTQDDRDKLQWVSISMSSKYSNYGTSVEKTIPYSKIFNRQDFWERDDESFLDYLKTLDGIWSEDRLLEMVNVGDKSITVFMFKSAATGFDITAEEWYGGRDKVPAYLNNTDWISDWMVNILILQGDWTNYKDLSVDTTFSQYFTTNGLLKSKIEDFANERTVTVLGNYDVSLIPNFVDLDGRDLYIKNVINNDTNKTGLFISYNEEKLLDADFTIDVVDIIGNNLVGSTSESINFMSYNQSIVETVTLEQKLLDSAGNVFAENLQDTDYSNEFVAAISRTTAEYSKWYVDGLTTGSTLTTKMCFVTGVTSGDTITCTSAHTLANLQPIYFNNTFGTIQKNTVYYVYIPLSGLDDATKQFKLKASYDPDDVLDPITGINYDGISIQTMGITTYINMSISANAYFAIDDKYFLDSGITSLNVPLRPVALAPNPSDNVTQVDVLYLEKGNDQILVGSESTTFTEDNVILGTITQIFATGATLTGNTISATYSPVSINGSQYLPIGLTITSGGTDTMIIDFSTVVGETYKNLRKELAYELLVEKLQDGAGQGKFVIINLITGAKHIVGSNYIIDDATIAITGLDNPTNYYSGSTFLTFFVDDEFVINGKTDRLITSLLPVEDLVNSGMTGINNAGVIGKHSLFYTKYYDGEINNDDYFYKFNDPQQLTQIYLRMYLNATQDLTIDFVNSPGSTSPEPVDGWTDVNKYDEHLDVISQLGSLKQNVELENISQYTDLTNTRKIWIDKTRYSEVKLGSFLERYYNPADIELGETPKKLVRVIKTTNDSTNINWKIVECDGPIKINVEGSEYQTVQYSSVEEYVTEYKGLKIKPFVMSKESVPNGTDERINTILSVIDKSTNLFKALVDKNKISWRYLVDSFGLGLNTSAYPGGSKQQLVDLCGEKKNCLGFISMPSVRDFKNSNNPSFVDADGVFSTALLLKGGDPDKNPGYLYEFGKGVGRSTVGYFFPYVRVTGTDGAAIEVPPAPYVATTYMQKFTGSFSSVRPWTICAGINNGRVEGIGGVEMDLNSTDEENLNQMGANPIVFRRNIGYVINSENTAQVFPRSSLSYLHSREVLIEIENRLYDMLLQYQWRFNTPEIRSEILYRANAICKEVQNAEGIYAFKNVMDETNNPDYLIDLQMGSIDTYLEIVKGMSIIVNNITILKKGAIESGGFM